MNVRVDEERLSIEKFGVGQPVLRNEDPTLVQGRGSYTDDVNLEGQVYGVMVRSDQAHGLIRSIDTETARGMPGVLAIYTSADLDAKGYRAFPSRIALTGRDGKGPVASPRHALARDRVTFVGDPVACVIAETAAQAQAAAEAVAVDIDPLPAVVDMREAAKPGAPQIYPDVPGNIGLDYHFGDSAAVAAAFAKAAHVTKMRITVSRIVINPMEPRACVAQWDQASQRFTLWAPTQGVMGSRANVAEIMDVAPDKVRFVAINVGGSFGMKGTIFPEYICALHGARELGRPVKWTDTRGDSFVSDHHGRAQDFDCELALDADGHFLAVRANGYGDLGGYMSPIGPLFSTFNVAKHLNGAYRTPLIEVNTLCVYTNTVPVTAYRGAGRPEGNYYMERLIDTAAAEMGIEPAELRRRNHIAASQIPAKVASGSTYDSGNFPAILDKAMEMADWNGYAARKAESESRGLLRGRGIGQFVEVTAPATPELGAIHFEADGGVTLLTGSHDHGQGHWTTFAQVLSTKLGIPFARIRFMQTDSDKLTAGSGTGGSKSLMSSGTAIVEASDIVIERARQISSHLLEAAVGDIVFEAGRLTVAGTDRSLSVIEIAEKLRTGVRLPEGVPQSLDVDHVTKMKPATFPNGCHIAEVEIDPETGVTELVRYAMVGDFGLVVNPIIVDGQVQGGVVQGLGQCLMEETIYTSDGQLATGSFVDYAMPRASDVPDLTNATYLNTPATTNPLGVKGCGEAGCGGSMTSIMNAVADALSVYGIRHIDMPASPRRVWEAIQAAKA